MIEIVLEVQIGNVRLLETFDGSVLWGEQMIEVALFIRNVSSIFRGVKKGAFKTLETFLLVTLLSLVN